MPFLRKLSGLKEDLEELHEKQRKLEAKVGLDCFISNFELMFCANYAAKCSFEELNSNIRSKENSINGVLYG